MDKKLRLGLIGAGNFARTHFDGISKVPNAEIVAIKLPVNVNNHNLTGEVVDFCNAILEDRPVVTDGINGASTVSVCLAIVESFKAGEKVKVDYDF